MDGDFEADSRANDADVKPSVTREDLNKTWIGLGAALEWIALRGQPMSLKSYRGRESEADEALVATLADLPSKIVESVVRGEPEEDRRRLVPIPSGIWRQTATSDSNDSGQPYRLIGTDDDDPWEGAILGVGIAGYRRIQIRSAFILENWPEYKLNLDSVPLGPAVARADMRRVIETIIAMAGDELVPISQREMLTLVIRCLPNARRAEIRKIYAEKMAAPKPGPKGPRDPNRERRIQELGQKLIAAQLHN